jgi:hypothetical protein
MLKIAFLLKFFDTDQNGGLTYSHFQNSRIYEKVEQNPMILSIFMDINVFGLYLECYSSDGSPGL